jgi:hypothetical protein
LRKAAGSHEYRGRTGIYRRRHGVAGAAGRGFDSRITVSQFRHWNVSKRATSSRDLLACMATPQTGQWRMLGRGCEVKFRSIKAKRSC